MSVHTSESGSEPNDARHIGEEFFANTLASMRSVSMDDLATAVEVIHAARRRGHRVYAMGNGGSASTASHLVCDLTRTTERSSAPTVRAFALVDNVPALTAYANDVSYDEAFARQVAANGESGDVIVAISASGRSPNILAALVCARRLGMFGIGLLGSGGGPAAKLVDLPLIVDSCDPGVIETTQLAIVHAMAALLGDPPAGWKSAP
jgi:D-sedoheptulose 7-phosphate isomerase